MEPYFIEQRLGQAVAGDELWRIYVDLDPARFPTNDGLRPFHCCDNIAAGEAHRALSEFRSQPTAGIGFEERGTGQQWFYRWEYVVNLRIMPMREAV